MGGEAQMRNRRRRSIRDWLDQLSAVQVAWMIDQGLLQSWPLELTRMGRRKVRALMRDS